MSEKKEKFCVIGIVTNPDFQKCKSLVERLKLSFSDRYETPTVIPLLDLDWNEYLIKIKREIGGKLWENSKPLVVFLNGNYLGDDRELQKYLSSIYKFGIVKDFVQQGEKHLLEIIKKEEPKGRKYVYMTIAVDNCVKGTMLFLLFNDFVPETAKLFFKRMKSKNNGFVNTPIHRIVKNSWIQCGGFDVKPKQMACENYIVPHNKRGVLSMCNERRHRNNSTQFFITLAATPWMNYRYVGFGQLVYGDKILRLLERLPTYYQKPLNNIKIVDTGEYLHGNKFFNENIDDLEEYLQDDFEQREDIIDLRYLPSSMSVSRFKRGLYFHCPDLDTNLSFFNLPKYLDSLYSIRPGIEEDVCSEKRGKREFESKSFDEDFAVDEMEEEDLYFHIDDYIKSIIMGMTYFINTQEEEMK